MQDLRQISMLASYADSRRILPRITGASIPTLLLLLGTLLPAAHAADRPDVLRAGSGLRRGGATAQYMVRKAECSRNFLGQTPLFKGEWVPHKVSANRRQMHTITTTPLQHGPNYLPLPKPMACTASLATLSDCACRGILLNPCLGAAY